MEMLRDMLGTALLLFAIGGLLALWTFLLGRGFLVAVVGPIVARVLVTAAVAVLAAAAARLGESLDILGLGPWL